MAKLKISILLLVLGFGLAGCQIEGEAPGVTQTVSPLVEPELTTTETPVPPPTASPLPSPTSPPPPATEPPPPTPPPPATATATAVPPDVPDLVWLPYGTGNFGEPVLMIESEEASLRELPVDIEIFFDYQDGWLAYGSKFWVATQNQDSVTELYLYNFAEGTETLWAEQVGRAVFSPQTSASAPPGLAVAVHNGQWFDLVLKEGPDNLIPIAENVEPFFSWSPDGSRIAYVQGGDLFISSRTGADASEPPIARGLYQGSGWIGDAPVWLGDSGYLLYAEAPFTIVADDGSETFVPLNEDGTPLAGTRPFSMLYASTYNQLITESEGMFGTNVNIYQFEAGFETAVLVEQIADAQLAGWFEPGQSVLLFSGGEATVLPLTPQE